jgi:hypothetical protein
MLDVCGQCKVSKKRLEACKWGKIWVRLIHRPIFIMLEGARCPNASRWNREHTEDRQTIQQYPLDVALGTLRML